MAAQALALAAIAFVIVLGNPAGVYAGQDSPEPDNRAGVLVRDADGEVRRMCVFFDEPSIDGVELLERTGLDVGVDRGSLGTAVCKIGNHGCPSSDCFCRFPRFWGYWTRDDGDRRWRFSEAGAAQREVRDGSIDGWSFGRDGKPAPPAESLDEVCAAAATAPPRAQAGREPMRDTPNYVPLAAIALVLAGLGVLVYLRRR